MATFKNINTVPMMVNGKTIKPGETVHLKKDFKHPLFREESAAAKKENKKEDDKKSSGVNHES